MLKIKTLKNNRCSFQDFLFFIILIFSKNILIADSFDYNFYNNHGTVGLINQPTARFFNEQSHGITAYYGDPDRKITFTSSPYDWLEASFFYTSLTNKPYCPYDYDPVCSQDYKDKGFNVKVRLKEEDGIFPAIALGFYDFAGTGLYGSEYIVASHGIDSFDFHFGLGWGQLNGAKNKINNPLGFFHESFKFRPEDYSGKGGQFEINKFFSGKKISPFYGISYVYNDNLIIKIETDNINHENDSKGIKYGERNSDFSYGIDYKINNSLSLGASFERGSYFSLKFLYKNNPKKSYKKYKYKQAEIGENDDKYTKLIKNLEENGIGVNRISETSRSIGLELTQFIHPDINLVEKIIAQSSMDAGITKNIKKNIKIANLDALVEIDDNFKSRSDLIYSRESTKRFNTNTGFRFRPFIAGREGFLKGALLVENNSEVILRENLFVTTNLKYSLVDNFDDLIYPPVNTFPAQVRSDIKKYLNNIDNGLLVGRAQMDYFISPKNNHHLMLSGGILEDMFSGIGMEYLYFKPDTNYSFGIELFKVRKRDYEWRFGHQKYENTIMTANYYYRNYGLIPFDLKISAGEYLAGDIGTTIQFSRKFKSGVNFGVFASITDVTAEQFGEGSFDKGIFFNIPIYGNLFDYTWRPLTKDPGAKLVRSNTLYDLLVRFQPIE